MKRAADASAVALRSDSGNFDALHLLALALAALGRHQRAPVSFDDELRLKPAYGAALQSAQAAW